MCRPTGFERMMDKCEALRKQIDWLCREIPRIGDEDEGFEAWTWCPTREAYRSCLHKGKDVPSSVCSECWKRESGNASKAQSKDASGQTL